VGFVETSPSLRPLFEVNVWSQLRDNLGHSFSQTGHPPLVFVERAFEVQAQLKSSNSGAEPHLVML